MSESTPTSEVLQPFVESDPRANTEQLRATMAEQGYPQLISTNWFGIAGPASTPEPIVAKLHAEIVKALAAPSVKERLMNIGVEAGGDTPDATQAFVLEEIERWGKVVKDTGTTIN